MLQQMVFIVTTVHSTVNAVTDG